MMSSESNLHELVKEVFSIVPEQEAISSSREVIEKYLEDDMRIKSVIKWAEFGLDGTFICSGISQVSSMSTRILSNWSDDDDLAEMIAHAGSGELKAGSLLLSPTSDNFFWFTPTTSARVDEIPKTRLRSICVSPDLVHEIVNLFNADAGLTMSETKMIFQLIRGLNPARAAEVDGVSFETKRTQLKNACAKLCCSGQVDLVRFVMGQMVHLIYMCDVESAHIEATERFTSRFLKNNIKLSVQRLSNGRLIRMWELGPAYGRPVVLIHGCLFPFILLNAEKQLEEQNIRLHVPIRPGYLDEQSNADLFFDDKLVWQSIDDLICYLGQFAQQPISLIGHCTGGYIAMLIAQKAPQLVDKMVVVSLHLLSHERREGSHSSSFFAGILKLGGDKKLNEYLVRQFQKITFSNEWATRFVLRRLFKDSPEDLDTLNGIVGHGGAFDWYRELHAKSTLGISSDFSFLTEYDRASISRLDHETTFVHSVNDPFTSVDSVIKFASASERAHVNVLQHGGHLVHASHPKETWEAFAEALADA